VERIRRQYEISNEDFGDYSGVLALYVVVCACSASVSQDGTVTLKGPVHSEAEKSTIEAKAAEIAGGPDKVTSEISVKQ
jgi:hypothetical protein